MKSKKAYFKNLFRLIFKTKARFLSIFIIVFLGAAFYAGLRQAPAIMRESIDVYLKDHNFQDIEAISTFGYTMNDIEAISQLDYINDIDYGYRFDVLITNEDLTGATVYTTDDFNYVNIADVTEGRLPTSSDEILIDKRMQETKGFSVGDVLTLESDYATKEYTVVGLVNDCRYICETERGVNTLGNGSNAGYIFMFSTGNEDIAVDEGLFDLRDEDQVYTEIRVTLLWNQEYSYFSDDYEDFVDKYEDELTTFIQSLHDDAYITVVTDAWQEIEDGEEEYNEGLEEYYEGLDEYNEGYQEYLDGVEEYEEGYQEYLDGVASYEEGYQTYLEGWNEYQDGLESYYDSLNSFNAQIEAAWDEINSNWETLNETGETLESANQGLDEISSNLSNIIVSLSSDLDLSEYSTYVYATNDSTIITNYESFLSELNSYYSTINTLTESIEELKSIIDSIEITHDDTTSDELLSEAIAQIEVIEENIDALSNYDMTSLTNAASTYLYSVYGNDSLYNGFLSIYSSISSESSFDELTSGFETIKSSLESIQEGLSDIAEFDSGYAQYIAGVTALEEAQEELEEQEASGKAQLEDAKKQLDEAASELSEAEAELADAKAQLDEAEAQLIDAKAQLDDAKQQLEEAQEELEDGWAELKKAKTKLENAKEDVESIEKAEITTLTTKENAGIVSYDSNADAIAKIALIFPLIFFLVAALVAMTTMTRMVEEQRVQSGTLRALGYDKKDVIMQYMIYAFLATFFACGIGIIFGVYFFPPIIYYLYSSMMFDVGAATQVIFSTSINLQTYGISVALILAVTWAVSFSSLNNTPASLLRPKAPKMGKRILLERITPIWKRLNFNWKVTMRNIFRYKKRFFMSVVGIAGCTALIIAGFGVKYSISSLAVDQYSEIFVHDSEVGYTDDYDKDSALEIENKLNEYDYVSSSVSLYDMTIETKSDGSSYSPSLTIPSSFEEYEKIAYLNTLEGDSLDLNDIKEEGVFINLKLSQLLDVEVGDTITVTLDDRDYDVKVEGIFLTYFYHYIIMSDTYYTDLTGDDVLYNKAQIKFVDSTDTNYNDQLAEDILSIEEIGSITSQEGFAESFTSMMDSLNIVIIILIVFAGILAFVVLYNLTNINIQERMSEIATIKVLGFYNKEVYDYVFRENTILSIIGSLLGLVFGYYLHLFLIVTVEIDMAHFLHTAGVMSYVYAVIITMVFTYLIDYFMRRVLNKIDMVESLKSIE